MSFETDLKKGKKWERIISECLKERGFNTKVIEEKCDYDIIDLDTNLKFEVKFDELSQNTGNVAIEVGTKSKPAGLYKSSATYWVHIWYDNEEVVYNLIPTYMLKMFLTRFKKDVLVVRGAGDGNAVIVLVPKEIFKHWRIHGEIPQRHLTGGNT